MYDSLAKDYDRFNNWTNRLQAELPFIEESIRQVTAVTPPKVLDAACGTGMHAIALSRLGFACSGADISPAMIEHARENAREANQNVDFRVAGFQELRKTFEPQSFDALLCLGNSLPHVLSLDELLETLTNFAGCLRHAGLLLLQSRNFDAVMAKKERFMNPEPYSDAESEWLFQRFYDFESNGLIRFNMVSLKRKHSAEWQAEVASTMLYPLTEAVVRASLEKTGFTQIRSLGNMAGDPFDPGTSGNLVITARRV